MPELLNTLLLAASRGNSPDEGSGVLIIVLTIVVMVLVIGTILTLIARRTRAALSADERRHVRRGPAVTTQLRPRSFASYSARSASSNSAAKSNPEAWPSAGTAATPTLRVTGTSGREQLSAAALAFGDIGRRVLGGSTSSTANSSPPTR